MCQGWGVWKMRQMKTGSQARLTDRHTDEQTDRLTDRQTDRPEIILRCGVLIISGRTDRKQTIRQT